MLKHPEVQRRAHEELDRVIKPGHLPTSEDEEFLPYTTAIVKEVLRWQPVTPIGQFLIVCRVDTFVQTNAGMPHCSTMEDSYKGYRIPVGSVVIGNTWPVFVLPWELQTYYLIRAIFYDEKNYPDPERFNPDRFMKDGKLDPDVFDPTPVAFGFGRR